jgi:ribosomal protein S10
MIYKIYFLSQKLLLLNNFSTNFKNLFSLIGTCSIIKLPIKIKKFTLLRSPHVNKKAREQFEIRTYKRLITLKFNNKNLILPLINQINFKLPQGLSMRIIIQLNSVILHI